MNAVLRLGGFEITSIEHSGGAVRIGPAIAGRSRVRIAAGTSCGARVVIFGRCGMRRGECGAVS